MRLIDADKLTEVVKKRSSTSLSEWDMWGVLTVIEQAPTINTPDPQPAKIIKTGRVYPYCSACESNLNSENYRFCPWCGALFTGEV